MDTPSPSPTGRVHTPEEQKFFSLIILQSLASIGITFIEYLDKNAELLDALNELDPLTGEPIVVKELGAIVELAPILTKILTGLLDVSMQVSQKEVLPTTTLTSAIFGLFPPSVTNNQEAIHAAIPRFKLTLRKFSASVYEASKDNLPDFAREQLEAVYAESPDLKIETPLD